MQKSSPKKRSKPPEIEIIRTFPVVGSDGVTRARCAYCEEMFEPGEPRSRRQRSLRKDGRYLCEPCIDRFIAGIKAEIGSGEAWVNRLLVSHADYRWIEETQEVARQETAE